MIVEYIAGNDLRFEPRLNELAGNYDACSFGQFNTDFKRLDLMYLIEFEGVGGILVDVLDEGWDRAIVQLLFVHAKHRNHGYGRSLVYAAAAVMSSKSGLLVGAYLDIADPDGFWKAIGFEIEATVNMSRTLICDSVDICFPNAKKEAITFESISAYLLKNRTRL